MIKIIYKDIDEMCEHVVENKQQAEIFIADLIQHDENLDFDYPIKYMEV